MERLYQQIVLGYYGLFKKKVDWNTVSFERLMKWSPLLLSILKYDIIYAEYVKIVSCVPLLR